MNSIKRAEKQRKQREKARRKAEKKARRQNAWQRFRRRIRNVILMIGALLFCGFAGLIFSNLHGAFSGRGGQFALWGICSTGSMAYNALPLWFWVGLLALDLYLWSKHKWVMSAVNGLLVGLVLVVLL